MMWLTNRRNIAPMVFLVALLLRLPGLGQFMTADEDRWILRSSWFWHEVLEGDFKHTFMTTHPGTTLMWTAGGAMALQAWVNGEDVHLDETRIAAYRYVAKMGVALTTSILIAISAWYLLTLLPRGPGSIAALFLAAEPYGVGLSQIVHLDALLSFAMLASLLALLQARSTSRWLPLIISGILLGLAGATKLLPTAWLVLVGGAYLLWAHQFWTKAGAWRVLRQGSAWLAVGGITFVVLCPALWQPGAAANENYTSGLATSYTDDAIAVATDEHIDFRNSTQPINPYSFYARTVIARATPLALISFLGVGMVVIKVLWAQGGWRGVPSSIQTLTVLLVHALGFLVLITFVAKKGDRYALPALVTLPILAGWLVWHGWNLLEKVGQRYVGQRGWWASGAAIIGLVLLQPLLWQPYAIAYSNGVIETRPLHQQGWGEGLDAAAAWLNAQPLASEVMYVATWYPRIFTTYFKGTTLSLSSRNDPRVAYVVTYRNMGGRENDSIATAVLEEFADQTPEHIVSIGGQPYVFIYNTIGLHYFGKHTGELLPGQAVGQSISSVPVEWRAIDIGLATFSSRANTNNVTLHIRDAAMPTRDLRTVSVNAAEIVDGEYHRFSFEPLHTTPGTVYQVVLTSEDAKAGNAITIKYTDHDILAGEMLWRRRAEETGETLAAFTRAGDIAYRLPDVR